MSALRLMTFNVRYFGHALPFRGAASTRRGIAAVTRALVGLKVLPHVLCLQEVEARSLRSRFSHTPGASRELQIEALMRSLDRDLASRGLSHRYQPLYFPAHAYRLGPISLYTTGLAILVRDDVKIVATNAADPHEVTCRPTSVLRVLKQSRICAHVRVEALGRTVDIFNTHLSLPTFLSRAVFRVGDHMGHGRNQEREVEALAEFIDERRMNDRFVVVGDFNALPGSPAYERLLKRLDARDAFAEHVGQDPSELKRRWPTAGFMHLRMRLDHVFSGRGLGLADCVGTHPFGRMGGRWHGLSDHVPIVCRLTAESAVHDAPARNAGRPLA